MNFFISDLHFGHKNCLAFDNRPFKTIEEHDDYIIKAWNETVNLDDDVYILGDISWHNSTKTIEIFKQLNGRLHLIKGNHDTTVLKNPAMRALFVEIVDYKELYLDKHTSIILCHYPIPCFKNHYYGWYHLYGHVHSSFEWNMMENTKRLMTELYNKPCKMYNIGAMMPYIDYVPKTLEQIISNKKEVYISCPKCLIYSSKAEIGQNEKIVVSDDGTKSVICSVCGNTINYDTMEATLRADSRR